MNTKRIVLSAIIAVLPFAANATQTIVQTQTPAAVGENGTVKKAATVGPYVTNEPTVADQTHIATTAYVKGAYNDAIAAVNKVDDSLRGDINNKQDKLVVGENVKVDNQVLGINDFVMPTLGFAINDDVDSFYEGDDKLVTSSAVAAVMKEYHMYITDPNNNGIANTRVRIYTTWDNDTAAATTLVPFETAQ